jgi:hypothetical protein
MRDGAAPLEPGPEPITVQVTDIDDESGAVIVTWRSPHSNFAVGDFLAPIEFSGPAEYEVVRRFWTTPTGLELVTRIVGRERPIPASTILPPAAQPSDQLKQRRESRSERARRDGRA